MRHILSFAAAIVLALVGGALVSHYVSMSRSSSIIGQRRIDFQMTDTTGKLRHLSEWDGKVVMLNFWATWCPPCQEEIPGFIRLQSKYGKQGLQIIGIAVDDMKAVRKFMRQHSMNYPVLVGDEDGSLTRKYGNDLDALPYTILINRQGKIVATHRGLFHYVQAEAALKALL